MLRTALVIALLGTALGCSTAEQKSEADRGATETAQRVVDEQGPTGAIAEAICTLRPTEGSTAAGTVVFAAVEGGVRIVAHVTGLEPGAHGFHVHEFGDCSAPDGSSAGPHFNPTHMPHAGPDAEQRHAGDLGNLTANAEGVAEYERVDTQIRLNGEHSIIGRGLIVHAQVDDLTTQPTGAAGARLACGVIEPRAAAEQP